MDKYRHDFYLTQTIMQKSENTCDKMWLSGFGKKKQKNKRIN